MSANSQATATTRDLDSGARPFLNTRSKLHSGTDTGIGQRHTLAGEESCHFLSNALWHSVPGIDYPPDSCKNRKSMRHSGRI